ncbi:hypothetical protein L1987_80679 [Smallanthus sonchifolius]|uniref:Uncharacterized protein n=1 Tax=Smallanthus sonchifolius TaxID=185202 RepID=A0ACB8YNS0_9ASTR|nr:hypothetical protein L1987_80679 [Smallanthus sonchifolius]
MCGSLEAILLLLMLPTCIDWQEIYLVECFRGLQLFLMPYIMLRHAQFIRYLLRPNRDKRGHTWQQKGEGHQV